MRETRLRPSIVSFDAEPDVDCDVFILGAGFEDRATRVLMRGAFSKSAVCILVTYDPEIPGNRDREKMYFKECVRKFGADRVRKVRLLLHTAKEFDRALARVFSGLQRGCRRVAIDISGLPAHAICTVLRIVRQSRPLDIHTILYTAAEEYMPTEAEYEAIKAAQAGDVEKFPKSMALEMSENYIPEGFAGHRTKEGKTALAVFAGYEVHRSAGVIDNINPAILLLLYGKPNTKEFAWRIELSRQWHKSFENLRRCAIEEVSTLDVGECVETLELYYGWLYDDFDLTIAPVCSKMQTVAAYLFWERYKEVQLAFPLPVGYDPKRRPRGVGETFVLKLPPSRTLYGVVDDERLEELGRP